MGQPAPDAGRRIPDSGFAGDTGEASPEVAAALAAYAADGALGRRARRAPGRPAARPRRGGGWARSSVDAAGLAHDKTSDMATVLLTGARRPDGACWRSPAPTRSGRGTRTAGRCPVPARIAAQSAVQDGADALVVDVAGPATFVVEGDDLTALAAGWRLGRVGARTAWIRPAAE